MFGLNKPKISRGASAVVTGAGSGIGAAFAVELGRRGGAVVCSDIDQTAAQKTADAITEQGGKAIAIRCDVSRFDEVQALAEQSQAWFAAAPTLVINNAGVGAGGAAIGDAPLDDWAWTLGINLWGPIHGCHVFTPILRDAESRAPRGIINVASAAAFGAAPGMAAYNVSKAGVLSLSETLAAELAGTPVRVTVLCPTFVKTNILESGRISEQSGELAAKLMRWTGLSAEKVARTCLDAHDRGELYCMPQFDAKVGWNIKRLAPQAYTRTAGLLSRINLP
ncbi:SDR family NAD(P)-dependent oxidoreductase [Mycobacterium intracellulare]|uniref:SDR family NAD(P)-dependent oxidoreductase n=1 Tax=Mycobacterium intracellulare subsp. chimaera TaxID=222805 RepID=A0A1Y0T5Y1_MYCIT|nr:SDR family NAD(P)-dependent oxidoreductase [Mycobacterium intracellulare]AOS91573.1 short-chain dehydrogenase [Mycobacterium intracellulare subsp. chimaera]ARV81644.1 short-chain dehydrogenase [Mycobacterium intracellulare subsp. chimaera]ASL08745.1 short chain dehydrogenase/reductase family oxidoreductase [Mycobacterium intracellulare subsp. chimaera]ASL14375.1 short chain dehydrogenase/reductase family oxidoreductase [Mycobacterium intracellulare subsp. chimaera]ASL20504.1 short chain deh